VHFFVFDFECSQYCHPSYPSRVRFPCDCVFLSFKDEEGAVLDASGVEGGGVESELESCSVSEREELS